MSDQTQRRILQFSLLAWMFLCSFLSPQTACSGKKLGDGDWRRQPTARRLADGSFKIMQRNAKVLARWAGIHLVVHHPDSPEMKTVLEKIFGVTPGRPETCNDQAHRDQVIPQGR